MEVNCKTCDTVTIQTFAGEGGVGWNPIYYYRCGCSTINESRTAPPTPKSRYAGIKRFLRAYKLRKT